METNFRAFVYMNCSCYPITFLDVGGLILLKPDYDTTLQFAATAAFLSKLYSDYLDLLRRSGGMCSNDGFSVRLLTSFSMSQARIKNITIFSLAA